MLRAEPGSFYSAGFRHFFRVPRGEGCQTCDPDTGRITSSRDVGTPRPGSGDQGASCVSA